MLLPQHLKINVSPLTILLVLGLFTPIICLLWFMLHAIDNDRIVIQKKLERLHTRNAQQAIQDWENQWRNAVGNALKTTHQLAPALQFKQFSTEFNFDAALIFDKDNTVLYPRLESSQTFILPATSALKNARHLDFIEKNKTLARDAYLSARQFYRTPAEQLQLLSWAARCDYDAGNIDSAYNRYHQIGVSYLTYARNLVDENDLANENNLADEHSLVDKNNLVDKHCRECVADALRIAIPAVLRAIEISHQHPEVLDTNNQKITQDIRWLESTLNNYKDVHIASRSRRFFIAKVSQLASALNTPVAFGAYQAEVSSAMLLSLDSIPTWIEQPEQRSLVEINSHSDQIKLFVSIDRLTNSLQTHLNSYFGNNTVIAYIAPTPSESNINSIFQRSTSIFTSAIFANIRWASPADYEKTLSKRQITYIAISLSVISFLCLCAVFTYRHLQRQSHLGKLKNDAISTIAHELKTPLTSIRLLLDNLIDTPNNTDKRTQEYVGIISQEHHRLSTLVDNFLTFSRFENQKFRLNRQRLDMNTIIVEAHHIMCNKFSREVVDVSLNIAASPQWVYADKSLILTILINLIDNACKYSRPPKQITLATTSVDNVGFTHISDSGIGLASKDQKRIFEQYFRVEQQLNRTTQGSGLGLYIAQRIAQAHGGNITVNSTLGNGSTFSLSLPLDFSAGGDDET